MTMLIIQIAYVAICIYVFVFIVSLLQQTIFLGYGVRWAVAQAAQIAGVLTAVVGVFAAMVFGLFFLMPK